MTVQSVQFDPRTSQAASETSSYWDNPAEQEALGASRAEAPAETAGTEPVAPAQATGDAVAIDGSDAGTRLPAASTPDGKPIQRGQLHEGEQVSITRERTLADAGFGRQYVSSDQVVLTTGAGNDEVQVAQRDDGTLDVAVNGERYELRLAEGQELTVRSGAGDDVIDVAPNVRVNVVVDGGAGGDRITTGAGDDRIDGGAGNDTIDAGDGRNDVFGNVGDDVIRGGDGANIFYGGDGDDEIVAGAGSNYIDGGADADRITGGGRSDMLSGGSGDDSIVAGSGQSAIYAGAGRDTVDGAGSGATVYAEVGDVINAATGARPTVVNIEIDSRLGSSLAVEGSDAFRQRMQAELDFLRSSPAGQQMLAELDAAAARSGNTVTIRELANEQNGYAQTFSNDADIVNGRPGRGGDVTISYNPSFHMEAFPAPVVVLYHEMSHAYNGVNGTFQPGTYVGDPPDSGQVPNAERQAVGLESSAPAFDFDGDPRTPPTTHNPIALTENGIRRELGLPDRPSYAL